MDLITQKEKENFCVLFNYSIKRAREVRKFHVTVVQRRLRNVQKSVMDVQNNQFFFFAFFVAVAVLVTKAPYRPWSR